MAKLLVTPFLVILAALLGCSGVTPGPGATHPAPAETPTVKPAATRVVAPGTPQKLTKISPTPASRRTPAPRTSSQKPSPTKAVTPSSTPSLTGSPSVASKDAGSAAGTPSLQGLSELLSMVPQEFADDTLVFSFNDPKVQGGHGQFPEGRAIHPEIAANIVKLKELLGLDFRNYERGIWSWKPGNRSSTFMVFQGPIEGQQTTD